MTVSAVADYGSFWFYRDYEQSSSMNRSATAILSQFSDEWIDALDRDDKKYLAMFVCHNLFAFQSQLYESSRGQQQIEQ